MNVLHAHVFAERGEGPAHADGGQRDGHFVEVTQVFQDALVRPQQIGLEQQQRHGLAERVQQAQHAQVAHLVLDVPQVDGQKELEVPARHGAHGHYHSNNNLTRREELPPSGGGS